MQRSRILIGRVGIFTFRLKQYWSVHQVVWMRSVWDLPINDQQMATPVFYPWMQQMLSSHYNKVSILLVCRKEVHYIKNTVNIHKNVYFEPKAHN